MAQRKIADYRKIYESHNGPIPIDDNGRTYEIHHKDGDHKNLSPDNLIAVTLQEHYDIHYSQGDYGACFYMAKRLKISPGEKSELARKAALKRVAAGTHNLVGDSNPVHKTNKEKLENGTHIMLIKEKCPYCGKIEQKVAMSRYHFDKCNMRHAF